MSDQEILEKALLKAHHNGWYPLTTIDWKNVQIEQWQGKGMVGIALLYGDKGSDVQWVRELEGIIFNHDFAKALWGHSSSYHPRLPNGPKHESALLWWQYHLQQMVIADDRIKYLGENI